MKVGYPSKTWTGVVVEGCVYSNIYSPVIPGESLKEAFMANLKLSLESALIPDKAHFEETPEEAINAS